MGRYLVLLLALFASDDPWQKVRELKSGAELRIYRKGAKQPILARMDELTAESLRVALKNEQTAIPLDEIDRIDARPGDARRQIVPESKVSREVKQPRAGDPGGPVTSAGANFEIRGKPDFEVVYRRPPKLPKP
jgi:hypothetical protein